MEIQIELEQLRKRKLFLATPMYGGACAGIYTSSMCNLITKCTQHGIEVRTHFLFNESLITRARNYCADEFLRSDCTHMLFVDSDVGFNADDVLTMLALQNHEGGDEYDVITGGYPKKCISWEKIKLAVDKGFADDDVSNLENFVGDYVFNPIVTGAEARIDLNQPVQIAEGGTGFMMIRRSTFERYAAAFPHISYRPDHARSEHFDGEREIHAFFDCIIDPESRRYLSEDYMFCHNVRKIGMKVWLCPWMQLQHVGSYIFGGSLTALAQIGADPTAGMVKKKKK